VTQTIERHIKVQGLSVPLQAALRETADSIVVG